MARVVNMTARYFILYYAPNGSRHAERAEPAIEWMRLLGVLYFLMAISSLVFSFPSAPIEANV